MNDLGIQHRLHLEFFNLPQERSVYRQIRILFLGSICQIGIELKFLCGRIRDSAVFCYSVIHSSNLAESSNQVSIECVPIITN